MDTRRLSAVSVAAALVLLGHGALAQPSDNGAVAPVIQAPAVVPQAIVAAGTIASDDTPTMVGRLFRDAEPSTCAAVKPFPGTLGTAPHAYDTFTYTNDGQARCVLLVISATCTGGGNAFGAFLAAYDGPFDPTNIETNYLGDSGSSVGGPGSPHARMAIQMSAGQTITLVVNQVNESSTTPPSACVYEVRDDSGTAVPALAPLVALLTAAGLAGLGARLLRRRG